MCAPGSDHLRGQQQGGGLHASRWHGLRQKDQNASTHTRTRRTSQPLKEKAAPVEKPVELELPSDDWAWQWEASEAQKRISKKRPAAVLHKASQARKFAKLASQRDELSTARAVQLAASVTKPCLNTPSAERRIDLMRTRVLNRIACVVVPTVPCSVECTDSDRA